MGAENRGISKEALNTLMGYRWPGNVRELANTIQKSVIFNRGARIEARDIRQAVGEASVDDIPDPGGEEAAFRLWIRKREGRDQKRRVKLWSGH